MKSTGKILISFIAAGFAIFAAQLPAQERRVIPDSTWRQPVSIPVLLAGNFAEPRASHFHAGIDIKTYGTTGYPVYAVADGTVVRIRVEPAGYGLALYVRHNNGYTTVYGHLQEFSWDLARYVRDEQYRKESFSVDLYPNESLFKVTKGEVIGFSGNSGSSDGPHLHFELRDTRSGNPVNPLLRGFAVADRTPPVMQHLYIYNQTSTYESWEPLVYPLTLSNGTYRPVTADPLPVSELVTFGIEAWEVLDGSANRCGIYRLRLLVDNELIFSTEMDEISYAEGRNVMSFMDYSRFQVQGKPVIRLFIQPNNLAGIYSWSANRGYLQFTGEKRGQVTIEAEDEAGNISRLIFEVKLNPGAFKRPVQASKTTGEYVHYAAPFTLIRDGITLRIPAGALFEDLYLDYSSGEGFQGVYGRVHEIHRDVTGLLKPLRLILDLTPVPQPLRSKTLAVRLGQNNSRVYSGGTVVNNHLETDITRFGRYALAVDTLPPSVRPVNFTSGEEVAGLSEMVFRVSDDLSGISRFRGEIDGRWVLFEYDPKDSRLSHRFDPERIPLGGRHQLTLSVYDIKGNLNTFRLNFSK